MLLSSAKIDSLLAVAEDGVELLVLAEVDAEAAMEKLLDFKPFFSLVMEAEELLFLSS